MDFKSLEEIVRRKNEQIPRWFFAVLICFMVLSVAGKILMFIWFYQQNNLNSLNNNIETLNKSVSTAMPIPKGGLTGIANKLQKDINLLQVEDAARKNLSSKIIELKQEINNLPKSIVSSERLTLDKDLLDLRKEVVKEQNGVVATLIQAFSGLFLFTTVVFSVLNLKETKDKQISERFSQAVEMLGADHLTKKDVILGGIYALERIAKDSKKDHWVVMEVLTTFVRQRASYINNSDYKPAKVAVEIQVALTVIGRRDFWKDRDKQKLNLRHTSLTEVDLQKAKLRNVDFENADLSLAHFEEADLRNANFTNAILKEAHFKEADLRGSIFENADVEDTNFCKANVDNKTDFSKALKLGVNIQSAKYFETANYNPKQRKEIKL